MEQALKFLTLIIVTAYVARSIGPTNFGQISYALAIAAIGSAICKLGFDSSLVRDIIRNPQKSEQYLGTSIIIALIVVVIFVLAISCLTNITSKNSTIITIVISGLIFQSLSPLESYFQANSNFRSPSIAKVIASSFGSISKLVVVKSGLSLSWLAASYALDYALTGILLFALFSANGKKLQVIRKMSDLKQLLSGTMSLTLASLGGILYMRLDQLMIKSMLGEHDLGLYSAVARIYEGWILVPYILSVAALPVLVKAHKDNRKSFYKIIRQLIRITFGLSALAALFCVIFGSIIVEYLFGGHFLKAAPAFIVLMLSAPLAALGSIAVRFFTVKRTEFLLMWRTAVALLVNAVLNYFLIQKYGIIGAAVSTLISLFCSNYLLIYGSKKYSVFKILINQSLFTLKF